MAFNINNTWKIEHFKNKNNCKHVKEHTGKWAIEDYDLHILFEPIISTLLFTEKIKIERGKNGLDYLLAKNSL